MQFDVETDQIRDHSKDVFGYAKRLQAAKAAATSTLDSDAFGPMLSFFGVTPPALATSTESSIGDREAEMEDVVQGLRSHARTHDANDQDAVDRVVRTLK